MNERFNQVINFLKDERVVYNRSDLARILGVSDSYISRLKSGERPVSQDIIDRIITEFPQVNPDWLLTGNGSMLIEDEQIEQENLTDANSLKYYYELSATASNIEYMPDNEIDQPFDRINFPGFEGCVAFNVTGESMIPTAKPKDIVVINPKEVDTIINGEIYLVVTKDGQRMVKRLVVEGQDEEQGAVIKCISDNPDQELYKSFIIYGERVHRIFRVKGFISSSHLA